MSVFWGKYEAEEDHCVAKTLKVIQHDVNARETLGEHEV